MYKSDHISNHPFKKMVAVALLSIIPTGVTFQAQAETTAKQSVEPTTKLQLPIAGSININSANAEELADALDGVGLQKAKAIVAWRQENGQFKQIEDLLKVKGIGQKILAANKNKINL